MPAQLKLAALHYFESLHVCRFTNCIVYYALALNAGTLGSGRYLPFVLFGLIEMPIYCITCVLINR